MRRARVRLSLQRMKIVIQHDGTHKYLRGINHWVKDTEAARSFPSSIDAFLHCLERGLAGVNIIIERPPGRPPLVVPVDESALEEASAELKVSPAR
jgi:hypothetical protein